MDPDAVDLPPPPVPISKLGVYGLGTLGLNLSLLLAEKASLPVSICSRTRSRVRNTPCPPRSCRP
jgi:hypothetical protein